jgi:hypothetical protein
MLKRITLFLFVVVNLNNYCQVVILDEIFLFDSTKLLESPDNAVTVTSPFYGRIYFRRDCMNNWTSTVKGEVVAGGESKLYGNYNCDCEGGSSCLGCIGSTVLNFYNKPMGTEVTVNVQYCYNHQWVEVPLQFEDGGNNRYNLSGMNPISGTQWEYMGYVKFIATTPPNCAYASTCSTGYIETMPDTLSVKKPLEFTYGDECAENPNALGVFMGAQRFEEAGNISDLTPEEDIEVCFDLQSQEWKFNLLVENVTLNYVKDICLDRIIDPPISATPLYNLESICQLPSSECNKLKNSIEAHKTYPLGSGIYDGYAFIQVLLTHETEHQRDWEKYVRKHIYKYYNIPDKIDFKCENFNSMQQAREEILKEIKDLYVADFWNPYKTDYLNGEYLIKGMEEMKLKREGEVHRRKSIKEMIKIYEDEITKFCKDECN